MNRINNIIDFKSIIEKLKNNKIVISVSGGLDSMVLLDGLSSVHPIVVHFNHNSRSDNSQDEKLVKDFCCLLYTSPSPRDRTRSRMPSSA